MKPPLDRMPPTVLERCTELGFKHHVFISWPHQIEKRYVEFVHALASGLQDKFRNYGGGSIYSDNLVPDGSRWDDTLRLNLCRSAVTVAIIVPTFFKSEYCPIEWAIFEQVTAMRLPPGKPAVSGFLPILLSHMPLPHEVADLQLVSSFQPLLVHSKRVDRHPSWPKLLNSVTDQILEILGAITGMRSSPDWSLQEELALRVGPKTFTWVPPRIPPSASPRRNGGFPGFVVENVQQR